MTQATMRSAGGQQPAPSLGREATLTAYREVRKDSERLCAPLQTDDYILQSIVQTSPPKWHLAHVSWFFETFLLNDYLPGYRPFHPHFRYLFNSYYEQVGPFHPRARRGMLSRPTVEEVYRYRDWIDQHMAELIDGVDEVLWPEVARRIAIGLNHEQQHQELLLTDIKHNFSVNPLYPAYREDLPYLGGQACALQWHEFENGLGCIGADGAGFAYDNESPRHTVYVDAFRLASRQVTNGEYLAFIEERGYQRPELWLSDGWATVKQEGWQAPLYWVKEDGEWWLFTLGGLRPLDEQEPVAHVSFYEAEAYARWAGHRLPTEQEWELATDGRAIAGNLRDSGRLHPYACTGEGLLQLYGDVWEWTASPYTPYPGYRAVSGALGEYNGKFMCNQMVLRGGSCITPADHIRASYRNFFYPNERWQFSGIRLAEDHA
jgi:ergothioneine biosynthesis protein EgtB